MTADVCLVLEGTYPFVTGGVSSWVNRLITELDHLTFTVLHVSPFPGAYPAGARYKPQPNLVGVQETFLTPPPPLRPFPNFDKERARELLVRFQALMEDLRAGESGAFEAFFLAIQEVEDIWALQHLLLDSREGWEIMLETYRAEAGQEGLLQFFWTWRFALLPLLHVLSCDIPDARCYHTVSTGYAGLLAAGAKLRHNRPMLLTEHGIYTKERRIDIQRSTWIPEGRRDARVSVRETSYFKRFWIRQFEMMGRVCYEEADNIYTLYAGNRDLQIADGAEPEKLKIVPNGIDLSRFGAVEKQDASERPFTVGWLGRICPIKDVRTLLRTARLVADQMPDVHFRVMGPGDEDPEYADQCTALAKALELDGIATFEGRVNALEVLPQMDVMVLSSISEAQPLVILEAAAFGVPTIATDVGSCSELLGGGEQEGDRELGEGGLVVPIANPGALAGAILEVARDPERLERMGQTMRQRVERFYDEKDMVRRYQEIYELHMRMRRGA